MLAFLSPVISFTVYLVRFSAVLVAPRRFQGFFLFFFTPYLSHVEEKCLHFDCAHSMTPVI